MLYKRMVSWLDLRARASTLEGLTATALPLHTGYICTASDRDIDWFDVTVPQYGGMIRPKHGLQRYAARERKVTKKAQLDPASPRLSCTAPAQYHAYAAHPPRMLPTTAARAATM